MEPTTSEKVPNRGGNHPSRDLDQSPGVDSSNGLLDKQTKFVKDELQKPESQADFRSSLCAKSLRETRILPVPGSTVQTKKSPGSTPSNAATGAGTVVRTESDLSSTRNALDSNDLATVNQEPQRVRTKRNVGQYEGRHVGTNSIYAASVALHVEQQMIDLPPKPPIREIRAQEMLLTGVRPAETSTPGEYLVPSQSGKGFYRVKGIGIPEREETCECQDYLDRKVPCKHIHLMRLWLREPDPTGCSTSAPPSPSRRTKRDFGLYDRAQLAQGRIGRLLLRDLSNGFPEPFKDPRLAGRKSVPLRDQAFCAVQRSYYGASLRDSHDLRQWAVEKELLEDAHSYSLVSHFLCREDITPGLHDMLVRSAIPLIGLENSCAIDSTGLRTTRFNYYRQEKYEPSRKNIWLKLHALVGVKTHAIPVLEVTAGSVGDSPQFPILLKRAVAGGFKFKEVYADKGYQSRTNFNTANELEILPFIPFKISQTGQARGSALYHKMFLFFQYHREEFDQHYGQRAQVESTFGNFKQKLSETLASRKFTSQVNEILCMGIAHNLRVLVRQMYESNILPDFLRPPASAPSEARADRPVEPPLFLNQLERESPVPQSAFSE
jgi:transposase